MGIPAGPRLAGGGVGSVFSKLLDLSLSFGIDAAVKVWLVGDYYHGRFNGVGTYFCHSWERSANCFQQWGNTVRLPPAVGDW